VLAEVKAAQVDRVLDLDDTGAATWLMCRHSHQPLTACDWRAAAKAELS
jgi:hypothetical protein